MASLYQTKFEISKVKSKCSCTKMCINNHIYIWLYRNQHTATLTKATAHCQTFQTYFVYASWCLIQISLKYVRMVAYLTCQHYKNDFVLLALLKCCWWRHNRSRSASWGPMIVTRCEHLQHDLTTEMNVLGERVVARFKFKLRFGRLFYIKTARKFRRAIFKM